jgi:hypothetical protein
MPVAPSFLFHGEVFPFGAHLEQPRVRNVQGALALPRVGGELDIDQRSWTLGPLGSFSAQPATVARVTARATGQGDARSSKTTLSCTIEGLDLPGILKADRLTADITSMCSNGQHSFTQDVTLDGLKVDDLAGSYGISRHVLAAVQASPTVAALRQRMQSDPVVRDNCMDAGTNGTGDVACFLLEPTVNNQVQRMPLRIPKGDTVVDVYVGEYQVADQNRRLTMLRIEMTPSSPSAAAQSGSVVFLELAVNGHKFP